MVVLEKYLTVSQAGGILHVVNTPSESVASTSGNPVDLIRVPHGLPITLPAETTNHLHRIQSDSLNPKRFAPWRVPAWRARYEPVGIPATLSDIPAGATIASHLAMRQRRLCSSPPTDHMTIKEVPMRRYTWLQRIKLAAMLLVPGVLGGLLTPHSSEAGVPTLTLKVDSGPTTSIVLTTPVPCTTAETSSGFTQCYAIDTSKTVAGSGAPVNRSYNVRNAPNTTARVRVGDKSGQDIISIAGVHFIPAVTNWGSAQANANEQHVLTITTGVTYDSTVNLNNSGPTTIGVRAGGEFRAGPSPVTAPTACVGFTTTGACNTVGDIIDLPGKGTFSPTLVNVNILNPAGSTTNTVPLRLEVKGPTSAIVSFDGLTEKTLGQVNPTYPRFTCDDNGSTTGGACKPTVNQTMTVRLKGPDSFMLVNGGDMIATNCAEGLSDKQEKQLTFLTKLVKYLQWLEKLQPNNTKLSAFVDKLEAFLATATRNQDPECPGAAVIDLFFAIEAAQDQIAFMADGAVPAEPAPPHFYAVINAPGLTWDQARDAAKGIRSDCDLATITSPAEQAIINGLLPNPSQFPAQPAQDYWIGGFQPSGSSEPDGNWRWINEEGTFWDNGPTSIFANWGSASTGPGDEPNNLGGSENHLTVDHRWGWGWNDLNTDGANGTTKGYVTEGTTGVCVPPVID